MLKKNLKYIVLYTVEVLVIFIFIKFVCCVVIIYGSSMENTLNNNDIVLVWRLNYKPKVGDMVITDKNNSLKENIVKRVIAVEGQKIRIENGVVWVDDELLNEPYVKEASGGYPLMNITVPEETVFLMGDNRSNSIDSRYIGEIKCKNIKGKIIFKIFPLI